MSLRFTEREANFKANTDDNTDIIDDNDIRTYIQEKFQIIDSLVLLYRHFSGMYILHAMFKWSKITDKQALNNLHSLFFSGIEKIQKKLFEMVANRIHFISDPIMYNLFELKPDELDNIFRYFQEFGLIDQAEQVLDQLWDASSDFVLPTFCMHNMKQRYKRPPGPIVATGPIAEGFYKSSPVLREMYKATDWKTAIKIWKSLRNKRPRSKAVL